MEFTEFAQILKPIIGGSYSTAVFTKTLFEAILSEENTSLIEDYKPETFKSYYNGKTKIVKIAKRILPYIDSEEFVSYLDEFPDAVAEKYCNAFNPYIDNINLHNASQKISNLFDEILTEAASQKRKSTPRSAKNNTKQDLIIKIPEEQKINNSPYSQNDSNLLLEFNNDYDDIMLILIGENYGAALVDLSLPNKIQELYTIKWNEKANSFQDLLLKANVYAVLGELNKLTNIFLKNSTEPVSIKKIRLTLRNLFVKLHPESFLSVFPYSAFIDDWDDGEF